MTPIAVFQAAIEFGEAGAGAAETCLWRLQSADATRKYA
jgi:hypothetical protein